MPMARDSEIKVLTQQIQELQHAVEKLIDVQNTQFADITLLLSGIDKRLRQGAIDILANEDEVYEAAKQAVIDAGTASASHLQRTLGLGYARASRLIDALEEDGVIGKADGAKPRKVLIGGDQ